MKKISIKKGFITQKMADNLVIFDGEESILYTFNSTAVFIFNKLKQGLSESEIADLLLRKYSITKDRAERDILEFISELKKNKIIS